MYGIFNMGIGMALAVAKEDVDTAIKVLSQCGEDVSVIGEVTNTEGVHFTS